MKLKLLPIAMAAAVSMFAAQAQASTISFDLNYVYTSSGLPDSTGTYLNATFRDTTDCLGGACDANTVQLVLTSSLEDADEFFTNFFFNSAEAVTTTYTSLLAGVIGDNPTISQYSSNDYSPAGQGGDFDVQIDFDHAPPEDRFNGVDSLLFTITGTTITASTFDLTASGSIYSAVAHLQGITPNCSAWVADRNGTTAGGGGSAPGTTACGTTVPDSGSTLALLGVAMMGVGYLRRRHI